MNGAPTALRRAPTGLRAKLNLGLLLIIGAVFVGMHVTSILAHRQVRRADAMAESEVVAKLIAGALLGELADNALQSPRIVTFLHNFLHSALTLNAHNRELAFALVVTPDNQVVAGEARPELVRLADNVVLNDAAAVLAAVAKADGKLGRLMSVKRFPLKLGAGRLVGKLLVGTSLARVEADARRDLTVSLAVGALALVLLGVYSSAMLGYLVVRPVGQVARAMAQVQRGDLTGEIAVRRRDEIGVLGDSYNFMVRGLREREKLADAFSRYVSPQVYAKLGAGKIALTGETRQATVLFSDIRGFTTLSEKLAPEQVVAMLNEYFDVMVDVVLAHDGFLNKFIGDALMAVYNVPLDQADHAERALNTAIEMLDRLTQLNAARAARGAATIQIGIGLNTGPVVAGNIGHERRLEYTVIGDAVNLAQRIETQTKIAGATLLISESTFRAVGGRVDAEPLPPVQVKGRAEPVVLYAVRGWSKAGQASLAAAPA